MSSTASPQLDSGLALEDAQDFEWDRLPRYEYEVLPSEHSIRLLQVHNIASYREKPLVGSLYEVELDENCPQYLALSYAWEGQASERNMLELTTFETDVGSLEIRTVLAITQNVEDALRRFQDFFFRELTERSGFFIWIDAVCINQSNLVERAQQVSIMNTIYERATNTAAWLGRGDALAMALFNKIWHWGKISALLRDNGLPSDWIWGRLFGKMISYDNDILPAVAKRPYWQRIWTLQELAHTDTAMLFCGKAAPIPFDTLITVMQSFNLSDVNRQQVFMTHFLFRQNLREMEIYNDNYEPRLRWSQAKLTSNPLDKIFAVRSLGIDSFLRIPIDYSKAPKEVYLAATRALIEDTRSLRIWEVGSFVEREESSPTWTVDFSRSSAFLWATRRDRGYNLNALQASDAHFSFGDSGKTIIVQGRRLGTVDHLLGCEVQWPADTYEQQFWTSEDYWKSQQVSADLVSLRTWNGKAQDLSPLAQQDLRKQSALLLCWCYRRKIDDSVFSKYLKWRAIVFDRLNEYNDSNVIQEIQRTLQESSILQTITWQIFEVLQGQRMFITSESAHIGVTVGDPRTGDVLVLLSGLWQPMLIRRTVSQVSEWQLVGPALVGGEPHNHPLLDKMFLDNDSELEWFVIV